MSASDEGELLSLIAHELRSPASVVAGYLRLLLREDAANTSERARHMIEEADRSCARVLQLVRELAELSALSGSRVMASGPAVPLFALCAAVAEAASADHGSTTFSCPPEDRDALVQGDAGRLKRALAALLTATLRERGDKALEIFGFVTRDIVPEAVVAFGDPGIALSSDQIMSARGAAFDRWRGGTGLSVPIAFRIVDACGGHLWAIPANSRAACALSLPLWQPQMRTASAEDPIGPGGEAEKIA